MNTWDTVYAKTFNNPSRNFSIGSEADPSATYKICSLTCSFKVQQLKPDQFISGMSISGFKGSLRIDPTVDTDPPAQPKVDSKTTPRKEPFILHWNGDFNSDNPALAYSPKGELVKYKIVDIFIQAPSKFSFMNQRYEMEVGLIFYNAHLERYVVMVCPMAIADERPSEESGQRELFDLLQKMVSQIPPFDTTWAVDGSPDWTPRMFMPRYDKRKFARWTDPKNPNVAYIVFFSQESALPVPRAFFNAFVQTLCGGTVSMQKALARPIDQMNPNTLVEINENQPDEELNITCETTPPQDPTTAPPSAKPSTKPVVDPPDQKPASTDDGILTPMSRWILYGIAIAGVTAAGVAIWRRYRRSE